MSFAPGISLGPPISLVTSVRITAWDPTATPQTLVVNCTPYLPAGAKAVWICVYVVSITVGDSITIREHGSSANRWGVAVQVASQWNAGTGFIRLNSALEFDIWASHLDITGVYTDLSGYYMGG